MSAPDAHPGALTIVRPVDERGRRTRALATKKIRVSRDGSIEKKSDRAHERNGVLS